MAIIHNSELFKELKNGIKLQQTRDTIPNQLAEKIVPVMEVNPKLLREIDIVRHAVQTTTGSITLYTTASDTDFYLSTIYASFIKDATCDSATGSIQIATTTDGTARRLLDFPIITLTAQDNVSEVIAFPIPVKIDKGVTITMSGTFTVGVMVRSCGLTGFNVYNPKS